MWAIESSSTIPSLLLKGVNKGCLALKTERNTKCSKNYRIIMPQEEGTGPTYQQSSCHKFLTK